VAGAVAQIRATKAKFGYKGDQDQILEAAAGVPIMRLRKTIPVIALFSVGASMTLAQDTPAPPYYPDDAVRKAIDFALRNIEYGKCRPAPCAPATAEEFANPPLTIAEARTAMDAALESAGWRWCGIAKRERLFDAYMRDARDVLKYDERKRHLLALVHGNTEVEAERAFDRAGRPCPPQLKKQLEAEAAQKFNRRP
jgi:hypothetical protein